MSVGRRAARTMASVAAGEGSHSRERGGERDSFDVDDSDSRHGGLVGVRWKFTNMFEVRDA